mmetsp:Transcript_67938/g.214952  ORF Transcript_67938/g.214952 Transcript_67938/m.214952 type:complete len:264 (+) Transcript_67938:575-1366(+)
MLAQVRRGHLLDFYRGLQAPAPGGRGERRGLRRARRPARRWLAQSGRHRGSAPHRRLLPRPRQPAPGGALASRPPLVRPHGGPRLQAKPAGVRLAVGSGRDQGLPGQERPAVDDPLARAAVGWRAGLDGAPPRPRFHRFLRLQLLRLRGELGCRGAAHRWRQRPRGAGPPRAQRLRTGGPGRGRGRARGRGAREAVPGDRDVVGGQRPRRGGRAPRAPGAAAVGGHRLRVQTGALEKVPGVRSPQHRDHPLRQVGGMPRGSLR